MKKAGVFKSPAFSANLWRWQPFLIDFQGYRLLSLNVPAVSSGLKRRRLA